MSSSEGASILDEALACLGQRITSILIQPADKDENYIASLHNEMLAAAWIIGLLASSGSSPYIPEAVKVAFRSFSDIRNPGTYAAHDEVLLPQAGHNTSVNPNFNFPEWWKFEEGEKLGRPFDVGDELVVGMLHVLERRLAGVELRARTIKNFKETLLHIREIKSDIERFKSFLEDEIERTDEKLADRTI